MHSWLIKGLILFGMMSAAGMAAEAPSFVKGVHYNELQQLSFPSEEDTVEVLEFFWYGCPHCYELEKNPEFATWLSKKPNGVHFQRVPVGLGRKEGEVHARLFYTIESLFPSQKESTPIHLSVFNAIHSERPRWLVEEADIVKFLEEKGVKNTELTKATLNSYGVNEVDVKKASAWATKYKIMSVPTFVVEGRYVTNPSQVHDFPTLVRVIDFLVNEARKAKTPRMKVVNKGKKKM